MIILPCPFCQKPLFELAGKRAKEKRILFGIAPRKTIVFRCQSEECNRRNKGQILFLGYRIAELENRIFLEAILPEEIIDDHPDNDLDQYLKQNLWQKVFAENGAFLGWWHPEISPMVGNKIYSVWAAQAFQNGIDEFLYSHLN